MNTTSIAVNRASSRPSTLWKTTLILIPFVTLGTVAVAASHRSERTQAAGRFVVWHGAILSAGQSEWAALWFRAVGWENLDRRFHLHNLPRALSDDQQPDE